MAEKKPAIEDQPKKEVLNLNFIADKFFTHFETGRCIVTMNGITEETAKQYEEAKKQHNGHPFQSVNFTTDFSVAQGIAGMDGANSNVTIVEGAVLELFEGALKIVGLPDNKAEITIT